MGEAMLARTRVLPITMTAIQQSAIKTIGETFLRRYLSLSSLLMFDWYMLLLPSLRFHPGISRFYKYEGGRDKP